MRIQHNIMALNAYRQLGGNNSALAKNLEKLSSGYRINRAGDDAAGLAISEKMRAQIKGLEAAQKNANDGISLVQTAEGALTEVHSMLNRMVYLATQSANGTYDNEVDRANLDKEVQTLKEEIDRISKSTNFNGLNLLDGSMNGAAGEEVTTTTDAVTTTMTPEFLPAKGGVLGTNTVLHKDTANGTTGTTFSVDLHNTVFSNKAGDTMTLKIGDQEFTLTGNGGDALSGQELVDALVAQIQTGSITFGGQDFTVAAGKEGDNRITFTQVAAPTGADNEVDGDMKVEITGSAGAVGSGTAVNGTPAQRATYTIDLSNATGGDTTAGATFSDQAYLDANAANVASTIDGVDVIFEGNIDKTMQKFVEDYNNTAGKDYEASWNDGKLTLTAKFAGALDPAGPGDGTTVPAAAPAFDHVGDLTQNQEAVKDVKVLDLTGATQTSVAGKNINGVAIDWDTDLDTTMKGFVEKFNKETSQEYTAEWKDNKLTMTAKNAGATGAGHTGPQNGLTTTITHEPATKATYTVEVDTTGCDIADTEKITINGTDYTVGTDITAADAKDADKLAAFIYSKLASNDYDITLDGNVITYTAKTVGASGTTGVAQPPFAFSSNAAGTAPTIGGAGFVDGTDVGTGAATFTNPTPGVDAGLTPAADPAFEEVQAGADADGDGVLVIGTPDYNFKTTAIKNVTANSGDRLASTYFDLTEDMVADGGKITIGKQDYTFTSNVDDEGQAGKVYIGDLLDAEGNVDIANNLDEIAQRITDAAKDNTTWTVGHDKGGATLSFVEKQDQTEYVDDKGNSTLTSVENIAETFGWTGVSSTTTTIEGAGDGKTLTLQVGDTADEFQKVTLNIKDMSTEGLDIADVNISTIEDATAAIDKIKAAINTVSAQRGDLGAVQNRLEHTINNLGVQTENITAAESRIRDTDMAEEMMAYTKNNILVQAAQAMLAQANQVPQGILQLLQ